uniref:Putative secreted protein n=1 Tax=Ixodes ricinus TaxID=34613 RepID=A0A6B0UM16_IXORI
MMSRLTLLVLFPSYGPGGVTTAVVVVADARSASGCSFCCIFCRNFGSYESERCDDACLSSSFWPELVRPTARTATSDSSCDAIWRHFETTLDARAVWDTKRTSRICVLTIAWMLQIVE